MLMAPHPRAGPLRVPLFCWGDRQRGSAPPQRAPCARPQQRALLCRWPPRPLPGSTSPALTGTPPSPQRSHFQSLGTSLDLPKSCPGGEDCSWVTAEEQGPVAGCVWGQGCANVTRHPLRAARTSPRGFQPTLGFCFAATAKQVLLGYKKALEAGQAGSRAAGIHARALAGCHRLTCQGKQWYLPRNRGTENTRAAQTPDWGSRCRARQPAGP